MKAACAALECAENRPSVLLSGRLASSIGAVPPHRRPCELDSRAAGSWQVSEESIKENFITVYQLMDEMMDNGIPMTTAPNVLTVPRQRPHRAAHGGSAARRIRGAPRILGARD